MGRCGCDLPGKSGSPASAASSLSLWGFALILVSLWMLTRPFRDIEHDSVLYTLYALARIHPEALGRDFFVRMGTQDHYTLFTPVYAAAIRLLGIDHAAAAITLAAQLGLFAGCWRLARHFMPAATALLGLAMVLALPSFYGGNLVFSYIEMFVTPRQLAEALVLAATLAVLNRRRLIAAMILLAATALHPIIALAGVMLWICTDPAMPRDRTSLLIAATVLFMVGAAATVVSGGPFAKFDPTWFSVLWDRLKYLWPTQWRATDWYVVAITGATLLTGAIGCARREARQLFTGVLVTAGLGLLGAMIGGDLMHLVLVGQAQTWRWLWLSGLVAVLFLPYLSFEFWQQGLVGRATTLLLAAGWLVESDAMVLLPAAAAVACALPQTRAIDGRSARTVLYGAWVALAVCAAVALTGKLNLLEPLSELTRAPTGYGVRIAQLQVIAEHSAVIAPLLFGLWWLALRPTLRATVPIIMLGAAACVSMLPYAWSTWTQARYSDAHVAAFAGWRRAVPPSAEVLWPGGTAPVEGWFLLQRASYWSLSQMSAMVFSRELTVFGIQREDAVSALSGRLATTSPKPHGQVADSPSQDTLEKLCARPDLRFVASWNDLGPTPYPALSPPDDPYRSIRLYKC